MARKKQAEEMCYFFSTKRVCKVCGCEDGTCSCHMAVVDREQHRSI